MTEIGKRIKGLLEKKGITQKELASRLDAQKRLYLTISKVTGHQDPA